MKELNWGQAIIPRLQTEHAPTFEENVILFTCRSLIYLGSMWLSRIYLLLSKCEKGRLQVIKNESDLPAFWNWLIFWFRSILWKFGRMRLFFFVCIQCWAKQMRGWRFSIATWQWHTSKDCFRMLLLYHLQDVSPVRTNRSAFQHILYFAIFCLRRHTYFEPPTWFREGQTTHWIDSTLIERPIGCYDIVKGSLVEKLPIHEVLKTRRVRSSHSSVK